MLLNERETLDRVLQSVGSPSVENVSIWEAGNRVLARDIVATVALPRFDNSTMDGYAVRAEDALNGARLLVSRRTSRRAGSRLECAAWEKRSGFTLVRRSPDQPMP